MWALEVGALCHGVGALSHRAPFDRALVFISAVLSCAQSTTGTLGAVRLDAALPTAGATQLIRFDLLEDLNLVAAAQKPQPPHQEAVEGALSVGRGGGRGGRDRTTSEPSLDLQVSVQPPDSQRGLGSLVSDFGLAELFDTAVLGCNLLYLLCYTEA